jgi:pyruvate dehydrogenase kinase 2/3/4
VHDTYVCGFATILDEFRVALQQGLLPKDKEDDNANINGDGKDDENDHSWKFSQHDKCQTFLDRFYSSRVGIRVLAGQYLALREQLLQDIQPFGTGNPSMSNSNAVIIPEDYVGMICKRTSPHRIVQAAVQDATRLCIEEYGQAPPVTISGRLDLTFCYIPTHLHYIMLELLKNAMRATMEFHSKQNPQMDEEEDAEELIQSPLSHYQRRRGLKNSSVLPDETSKSNSNLLPLHNIPAVAVVIADSPNNEDVIIKVMDEGGGIPRSQMDSIWSYLFTTADKSIQEAVFQSTTKSSSEEGDESGANTALSSSPILAGLGFGLPMSRAYARYFGGDLDLISLEGFGCDAYLHLCRLGGRKNKTQDV